eukprot:TRINITY_DN13149_c0_g1_i1.p1 TRINITY_DN13149_c0_g1~~TRINITY_DN13149_c0_g1_i1.p1  ORF type:complete len:738 (-),score=70.62 TRINITY_DN13149_c0_g1_i1:217-2430(-)
MLLTFSETQLGNYCNSEVLGGALFNTLHQDQRRKAKRRRTDLNFVSTSGGNMQQFAYGIDDFSMVSKCFYIDRTMYIPEIEAVGDVITFFRPRRFGKSLLLSTLSYYYDIRYAEQYGSLFGHLYIASQVPKNLSSNHNTWLVLSLNLSTLNITGEFNTFERSFHEYFNTVIIDFKSSYQKYLSKDILISQNDSINSFLSLTLAVKDSPFRSKLYIFIDEYDTSVNEVVRCNNTELIDHLKKDCGMLSTFRRLFSTIKAAIGAVGKVFITGVAPLALNEFTSGFNITTNITFHPTFSMMCGFSKKEVTEGLSLILEPGTFKYDEALVHIERNFNGYCFNSELKEKVYNPTMMIFFLHRLKDTGKLINEDQNVRPSEAVLRFISCNPHTPGMISHLLVHNTITINRIHPEINITHLVEVKETDKSFLVSFLYYLGALSIFVDTPSNSSPLTSPTLVPKTPAASPLKTQISTRSSKVSTSVSTATTSSKQTTQSAKVSTSVSNSTTSVQALNTSTISSGTEGIVSSTQTQIKLHIPNEQCRREYFIALQHIFDITPCEENSNLQTVVTKLASGDIEPLCSFITTHILNLQKYNDVIHSMEHSLKSVFVLAVSIARGPKSSFYNLIKTQADAMFFLSPGTVVHIEFKNTTIGHLKGKYNSRNWEKMNQESETIFNMDDAAVLEMKLQLPEEYNTCGDLWRYTLRQTKENKTLFEVQNPGVEVISFAVYRIGLKKLIYQRVH